MSAASLAEQPFQFRDTRLGGAAGGGLLVVGQAARGSADLLVMDA